MINPMAMKGKAVTIDAETLWVLVELGASTLSGCITDMEQGVSVGSHPDPNALYYLRDEVAAAAEKARAVLDVIGRRED